jgi:hypothetical protein
MAPRNDDPLASLNAGPTGAEPTQPQPQPTIPNKTIELSRQAEEEPSFGLSSYISISGNTGDVLLILGGGLLLLTYVGRR